MHKACLVTEHDEASTTPAAGSTGAQARTYAVGVVGAWAGVRRGAWVDESEWRGPGGDGDKEEPPVRGREGPEGDLFGERERIPA